MCTVVPRNDRFTNLYLFFTMNYPHKQSGRSKERPYYLIDNGHGVETPGKRSPDGRLLEWEWTRRVARRVAEGLRAKGLDAGLLVPEDRDVPLRERTARANAMEGACMLISIHANAAGRGEWRQARGWSAFVAPNASADSKRMASLLAKEAERLGLTVRRPMPGQDFWVQNLAICRDTRCPAVLTENLFMDNKDDLAFMLSEAGIETIANLHINAIVRSLQVWSFLGTTT